jgi:hypothetical protein
VIDARWEHGSEFDWNSDQSQPGPDFDRDWLASLAGVWFASGRGALSALVEQHPEWPRVWLPSYVCSELLAAVGERARWYACDPIADGLPSEAEPGDAVVRINYFGLRTSLRAVEPGIVVIADHTHDPFGAWARDAEASYGLASLRKSLPLPDGALLWSRGAELPLQPAGSDEAAAKLPAMLLKAMYLAGQAIEKPIVRELAIAGEARLASLGSVGMSRVSTQLLATLAISELRARRRENFATFAEAIGDAVELLHPDMDMGATPFACVVRLRDRTQREHVRAQLIEQRIYPAVLWDLDAIAGHRERFPATCELADQLLAIHCDARYGPADMRRVAASVRRACG